MNTTPLPKLIQTVNVTHRAALSRSPLKALRRSLPLGSTRD